MQTSKLLRNRRKTYILNVICTRFYFGEVQEEVQGQCSGQGISAPRTDCLSVYQRSVTEKKIKQGGSKNAFVNTLLKLQICLGRSRKIEGHCKYDSMMCKNTKAKKRALSGFLVDHPCKFHAFSNSLQEIPHAIPAVNSMSLNLLFGFFTRIV